MPHNFQPFPTLTTKRLLLRESTLKDVNIIFFLRSNQEVMKYISRPVITEKQEATDFFHKVTKETKDSESLFWAITIKNKPGMIGAISLWNFSDDLLTAEVGYSLHPDFHNQGIMSEALVAVLEYGFKALHFQTIEAFTDRLNEPSKRMLLKNGFVHQPDRFDEGNLNNSVYALNAAEFENQQPT